MPFLVFQRDHLRSTSGITCGSGSFAVQFGDYFRSGDHLRRCTDGNQEFSPSTTPHVKRALSLVVFQKGLRLQTWSQSV